MELKKLNDVSFLILWFFFHLFFKMIHFMCCPLDRRQHLARFLRLLIALLVSWGVIRKISSDEWQPSIERSLSARSGKPFPSNIPKEVIQWRQIWGSSGPLDVTKSWDQISRKVCCQDFHAGSSGMAGSAVLLEEMIADIHFIHCSNQKVC